MTSFSKPKNMGGGHCPMHRKPCIKVCHDCELWDHVRGKNPQTGGDIDHWACAFKMQTLMAMENTMAQRQTTGSIDHLRKEVAEARDHAMVGALSDINARIGGTATPLVDPRALIAISAAAFSSIGRDETVSVPVDHPALPSSPSPPSSASIIRGH